MVDFSRKGNASPDSRKGNASPDSRKGNASPELTLLRPADIILSACLIAAGFLLSFLISFGGSEGEQIRVSVAGETYGIYSLLEDRDVTVGDETDVEARSSAEAGDETDTEAGSSAEAGDETDAEAGSSAEAGAFNTFRIRDGKVKMIDSNCRGGDCIHEGEISKTGETIVCLPHKVIIEVVGGEEDFDAISR